MYSDLDTFDYNNQNHEMWGDVRCRAATSHFKILIVVLNQRFLNANAFDKLSLMNLKRKFQKLI